MDRWLLVVLALCGYLLLLQDPAVGTLTVGSSENYTSAIGANHTATVRWYIIGTLEHASATWWYNYTSSRDESNTKLANLYVTDSTNTSSDSIDLYNGNRGDLSVTYDDNLTRIMKMMITLTAADNKVPIIVVTSESVNYTLVAKYCDSLVSNQSDHLEITNPSEASYQTIANYSCSNSQSTLVLNEDYKSNEINSYQRNCQANATWSGTDQVSCWYAPNVTLNISPVVKSISEKTVISGSVITLNCIIGTPGYPIHHNISYFKNGNKISEENFTASPSDNNQEVYCQVRNEYVVQINSSAGNSKPVTLDVLFQPENNGTQSAQQGKVNDSASIVFEFESNPLVSAQNLTLNFSRGTDINHELDVNKAQLNDIGGSSQKYMHFIDEVKEADFGDYKLTIMSPYPEFTHSVVITITLTNNPLPTTSLDTTTIENLTSNLTWVYIVIGAVGGILLILIALLLFLKYRRQANIKVIKEERENPIYDTSAAGTSAKEERVNPLYGSAGDHFNTEKEEKANPLYNQSAVNASNVEEAYAEVQKTAANKKKGRKGNENPVFSVETSLDTYAEVKKPKKKTAPVPEDTYAEVQKDRKKKKTDCFSSADENINNDLHGSDAQSPMNVSGV